MLPTTKYTKGGYIALSAFVFLGLLIIWGSYVLKGERTEQNNVRVLQFKHSRRERNLKEYVTQACMRLQKNASVALKFIPNHGVKMLMSEEFKLLGCDLPKVASTNTGRILYTLDHLSTDRDTSHPSNGVARKKVKIKAYKDVNELKSNKIKQYTKFMFVRDPLERLLSAYRKHLPRAYFKNHTPKSFNEFLNFVLGRPDKNSNKHVVSFNSRCLPCAVKYDFIGSLDSFEKDMKKILRSVGAEKEIIFLTRNQTGYTQKKSGDVLKQYLKGVPKDTLQRVYGRYSLDYYLFGFKKPSF